MADVFDAIIIATASTAIAAIVVAKFVNTGTEGGGQPKQSSQRSYTARAGQISPKTPKRLPTHSAPLAQNTPITEAAYNVQPTSYAPTLGPDQNTPSSALTLPI